MLWLYLTDPGPLEGFAALGLIVFWAKVAHELADHFIPYSPASMLLKIDPVPTLAPFSSHVGSILPTRINKFWLEDILI